MTDTSLDWLRSYLETRTQFVKLGQHQSPTVGLDVGVPQGSVLGSLLFAIYCSRVADVILPATEYSTISMLTTRSSVSPCTLTTHPTGCPFSPVYQ